LCARRFQVDQDFRTDVLKDMREAQGNLRLPACSVRLGRPG
jgi:hypothetical protein